MYTIPADNRQNILTKPSVWLKWVAKLQIIPTLLNTIFFMFMFVLTVSHDEIFKVATIWLGIIAFCLYLPTHLMIGLSWGVVMWWYFKDHPNVFKRFTIIAAITTCLVAFPIAFVVAQLWFNIDGPLWAAVYYLTIVGLQLVLNTVVIPQRIWRQS